MIDNTVYFVITFSKVFLFALSVFALICSLNDDMPQTDDGRRDRNKYVLKTCIEKVIVGKYAELDTNKQLLLHDFEFNRPKF